MTFSTLLIKLMINFIATVSCALSVSTFSPFSLPFVLKLIFYWLNALSMLMIYIRWIFFIHIYIYTYTLLRYESITFNLMFTCPIFWRAWGLCSARLSKVKMLSIHLNCYHIAAWGICLHTLPIYPHLQAFRILAVSNSCELMICQ